MRQMRFSGFLLLLIFSFISCSSDDKKEKKMELEIGSSITVGMSLSDVEKKLRDLNAEYSFIQDSNYIQFIIRDRPIKQGLTIDYLAGKIYFDQDTNVFKIYQNIERTGP